MLFTGSRQRQKKKSYFKSRKIVTLLFCFILCLTLECCCILNLIPPIPPPVLHVCTLNTISDTVSLFLCLSCQISDFPIRRRKGTGVFLDFPKSDKNITFFQLLKTTTPVPAVCFVSVTIFFRLLFFSQVYPKFLLCL